MNVHHWLADMLDDDDAKNAYQSLACPACARLYFIHPETGKLLGEEK